MSSLPEVTVIILNWNGWKDTVACLDSLAPEDYPAMRVLVVDNGSEDDSVARIRNWIAKSEWLGPKTEVMETGQNLGFAGGCNAGIRAAMDRGAGMVLLMNNDTIAESGFLRLLVEAAIRHPDVAVCIPQIRYAGDRQRVWNCGGAIHAAGYRTYLYYGRPASEVPRQPMFDISFATGCCMLFDPRRTGTFTERFFFGEEDFEFSMRMKKQGMRMVCIPGAVIYHKVSATSSTAAGKSMLGLHYIYYLSRYIDMRQFMHPVIWRLWRWAYLPYILYVLGKGHAIGKTVRLARVLMKNSSRLDGVSREHFFEASRGGLFPL